MTGIHKVGATNNTDDFFKKIVYKTMDILFSSPCVKYVSAYS